MKQGWTILWSLMFFLGSALLLLAGEEKGLWEEMNTAPVMAVVEEPPEASSLPEPSISPVPVITVEEAWDEIARENAPESSPEPVTVDSGGTLELRNETGYAVELSDLPTLPQLEMLQAGQPVVLIMHTHGSEAYTDPEISGYRSQNEAKSVIAVGDVIRRTLEGHGYAVLHDKTLCDYPEYTGAYNRSRTVIQQAVEQYPGIFLVLDIHRDAVEDGEGNQMRMACTLGDEAAAQLMLVVGTDAGGLDHPAWQRNLSLATVLQMRLSGAYPGLMRPLNLRTERFNQDLAPLTLLVEVGASGNTLEEAKLAAKTFAEALSGVLDDCGGKSS